MEVDAKSSNPADVGAVPAEFGATGASISTCAGTQLAML